MHYHINKWETFPDHITPPKMSNTCIFLKKHLQISCSSFKIFSGLDLNKSNKKYFIYEWEIQRTLLGPHQMGLGTNVFPILTFLLHPFLPTLSKILSCWLTVKYYKREQAQKLLKIYVLLQILVFASWIS